MPDKDRLAATLLNHWYCLGRSTELGIVKVAPGRAKYEEQLKSIEDADDKRIQEVIEHFQNLNRQIFTVLMTKVARGLAVVEAKTRAKTATLKYTMKSVKFNDFPNLLAALQIYGQLPELVEAVGMMPPIAMTGDGYTEVPIDIKISGKDFFDNLALSDQFVGKFLDACQRLEQVFDLIQRKLTKEQLNDAMTGQLNVVFQSIDWVKLVAEFTPPADADGKTKKPTEYTQLRIKDAKFELVETENAKASRELKARIEEALRKRVKKVRDLAVEAGSVKYNFEDTLTPPLHVDVDVITQW